MIKKIVAFLLMLTVLAAAPICTHAAGTELTVSAPASVQAGEHFDVAVRISGNPGFASVQLTLEYDRSLYTCDKISKGPKLSGMLAVANPEASGGAKIAAASSSAVTGDGVLAVLTFTAKQGVSACSIPLKVGTFSDSSGNKLTYTIQYEIAAGTSAGVEVEDFEDLGGGTSEGTKPLTAPFTDTAGHWAEAYIAKAVNRGLFSGYADGSFGPDDVITRAQFVTVIWRMAGKEAPRAAAPFTDIADQNAEFRSAIAWGYERGLISGVSATAFDPDGALTREAAMKILFQYNGGVGGMELMLGSVYDQTYTDSGKVSAWAKSPMYWGVYNEIITGTSATTLSPQNATTRAQLAKILVNYLDKNQ